MINYFKQETLKIMEENSESSSVDFFHDQIDGEKMKVCDIFKNNDPITVKPTTECDSISSDSQHITIFESNSLINKLENTPSTGFAPESIEAEGPSLTSVSKNDAKSQLFTSEFFDERSNKMIIVSYRQKGNRLLDFIQNVPYEFGNIIPDYLLGKSIAALFISLKYHRLHSCYILKRIESIKGMYKQRILLCLVDYPDHEGSLGEVTQIAFHNDMNLFVAWTSEEAAQILERFKILENKSPEILQGKVQTDHLLRVVDTLTNIKPINKTDVMTLVSTFGSVRNIILAKKEELHKCHGIGNKKIEKLLRSFNDPFHS